MTFLQPWLLWALPLALLPVAIHLLNRMRYRSVDWAAMRFLLGADRTSTRRAKLRQILILLLRCLALALLILAFARPLIGGWLGWAFSPAPDTVLLLLDRSASMEQTDTIRHKSWRDLAIERLAEAGAPLEGRSCFVLFDSARREPQEVVELATLSTLSATRPTETGGDWSVLLRAATDWLEVNRAGRAEIWIASDLQQGDWRQESATWRELTARLAALPGSLRIRLLSLGENGTPNRSVHTNSIRSRNSGVDVEFVVSSSDNSKSKSKLEICSGLGSTQRSSELEVEGTATRLRQRFETEQASGWGGVELPPDGNPADNRAHFIFGKTIAPRVGIITADEVVGRLLVLASAPVPNDITSERVVHPTRDNDWSRFDLVVWQGTLPEAPQMEGLERWIKEGGTMLCLPPERDSGSFAGVSWQEVETNESPFGVEHWRENEGPLSNGADGVKIPLMSLAVQTRRIAIGKSDFFASFADGRPLLSRATHGQGAVWFFATLPQWSRLGEGRVLVPMLQRLATDAARRRNAQRLAPGEQGPATSAAGWMRVDSSEESDAQIRAGIYRDGDRFIALNVPVAELDSKRMTTDRVRELFAGIEVTALDASSSQGNRIQGEAWKGVFVFLWILLLAEALLTLPGRVSPILSPSSRKTSAVT